MGSFFRSGEQSEDGPVDPFENAVNLAKEAERIARKGGKVSEHITASTQWLAIAQIHNEIFNDSAQVQQKGPVGFTGGEKENG